MIIGHIGHNKEDMLLVRAIVAASRLDTPAILAPPLDNLTRPDVVSCPPIITSDDISRLIPPYSPNGEDVFTGDVVGYAGDSIDFPAINAPYPTEGDEKKKQRGYNHSKFSKRKKRKHG